MPLYVQLGGCADWYSEARKSSRDGRKGGRFCRLGIVDDRGVEQIPGWAQRDVLHPKRSVAGREGLVEFPPRTIDREEKIWGWGAKGKQSAAPLLFS